MFQKKGSEIVIFGSHRVSLEYLRFVHNHDNHVGFWVFDFLCGACGKDGYSCCPIPLDEIVQYNVEPKSRCSHRVQRKVNMFLHSATMIRNIIASRFFCVSLCE